MLDIKNNNRISWDEYFLDIMASVAKRATCSRGRSASLIVKDHQLLATGYVGSPPGMPHCSDVGHLMTQFIDDNGNISDHCSRTIHSEQNSLMMAAKLGISVDGATIYCKMEPCRVCSYLISVSGIKRVVALYRYHAATQTREVFENCGIELVVINKENTKYE